MDDIVFKSRKGSDLLTDLAETFANLRRYDIKLNPSKCTFGVPGGKLLGFLVSERGIDANPEKVGTILRMKSPVRVPDVQKLTGCLAALSRFISRLGEKALPLYRLMKKSDKFEWTPEANAASDGLPTRDGDGKKNVPNASGRHECVPSMMLSSSSSQKC